MFGASSRRRWIAAIVACCVVLGATAALADAKADANAKAAAAQAAMMEAMAKAAIPGPQHEMMKKCEGSWKTVTKAWMAPGEPVTTEGTSEYKMILGGRYLEQRYNGSMMGQPFEGYGLTGYDNIKNTYTTFWIDNNSTSMVTGTGSYDEAKKMLTFKATAPGPDGKPVTMRMTIELPDDNNQVFTMYTIEKGKESRMMEITYTRM